MATKEKPVKVVFRKYKSGEIIALFPEIPWNTRNYTTTSYMHSGQHSAADYTGVIADTTPASQKEYQSLFQELKNIGYQELHIIKRSKPVYR